MDRFALARHDAAAVDAQAVGLAVFFLVDQAELDRVPVQPREVLQRIRADPVRFHPALAVGLHVVGEQRVHQQRHMAEQIVEEVGLLDVIDLVGATDPPCHRETAVGQVVEEIQFRQQAFDADQGPAGGGFEHRVDVGELRDAVRGHPHRVLRGEEFVAGAADQDLALALVQLPPHVVVAGAVVVPRLLDDAGGVHRDLALVGDDVLEAGGFRVHGLQFTPAPLAKT